MNHTARQLLRRWIESSEPDWTELPDGGGFYGSGFNNWGVQTQQKYLAAAAVLATEESEPRREWFLQRARTALRFNLASHLSGEGACSDGTRWGHTWISALGIERMMHGVHRLRPHLSEEEQAALSRVLISEADWLLTDYRRGPEPGIMASRWARDGGNDPESNIWNGCLLWRTARLHPDHPHAGDWSERAHAFLLNGTSIEADARDETVVAGKPVRERHVGANFFPGFALDHHGYFNVGYMVICASNAALLHFDARLAGFDAPESLYHHQADLWAVLHRLVFGNGRLARIGGDTRVRYAYCQEYLLPSLLFAADRFGDAHAPALIENHLRLVAEEARHSGDGLFYSRRLAWLRERNPYYYTRLESDRAAVLGMLIAHHPLAQLPSAPSGGFEESRRGGWTEPEYGAALHRSPTRLASFAWRAKGLMQGMCQPPDDGHLTEWQHHLGGLVEFVNQSAPAGGNEGATHRDLLACTVREFPGGFATWGAVREGVDLALLEGWKGTDSALHQMLFVALPDDHTVVALQHCRTDAARRYVSRVRGLQFNLLNDFYNQHRRVLRHEAGRLTLRAPAKSAETRPLGKWVSIGGRVGLVGLYGAGSLVLSRSSRPRDGALPSLCVEEIAWPLNDAMHAAGPGAVLLDAGWAVLSAVNARKTRAFAEAHAETLRPGGHPDVRIVQVQDQRARRYWIAAHFGNGTAELQAPAGTDLLAQTRRPEEPLRLAAGECALRRMD